ncbi:MAG: N-acetylmuramoyl-L-alanine amidase family protein [Gemmatimonadota bacterium]
MLVLFIVVALLQPAALLAQSAPLASAQAARTVERVVVIDAGHGGKDPGKVGPTGLTEKTVTLTIALKLEALLRARGYEVHLTRASDTLIALADRPKLANEWKKNRPATLFVSIHANAGGTSAEGYETYFLSEARTEDERRVAEMENAAVAYEEKAAPRGPAIDLLLNGLRNDYYQRASNDFAEVIQRELGAFHPGRNRGVKQAGFRVLVGALMPAVLVEIAFISNAAEARLLGTAAFQDKIAYSLARSIANFFNTHEHLFVATEVPQ